MKHTASDGKEYHYFREIEHPDAKYILENCKAVALVLWHSDNVIDWYEIDPKHPVEADESIRQFYKDEYKGHEPVLVKMFYVPE